jgi:hypothetical protein
VRLTRLVPLYAALLLALAGVGALNQARFSQEARLIDRKDELYAQITELRAAAALVQGPLAVSDWAREQGMVPTPDVSNIRHVAPFPAPRSEEPATGLEVRTAWR